MTDILKTLPLLLAAPKALARELVAAESGNLAALRATLGALLGAPASDDSGGEKVAAGDCDILLFEPHLSRKNL